MFVDSTTLTLSAGKGGNGAIAWRREKFIPKGGPTGGNGGKGGSVFLVADNQTLSLEGYRNKRIIVAQNGACGGSSLKQGKAGQDLFLKVPCGTLVKDKKTKKVEGTVMACYLIPKKVINEIGVLEEKTFMYFEDIDLCRRVQEKYHLQVVYFPEAEVIHDHARQSAQNHWLLAPFVDNLTREHIKSWLKYFFSQKN